MYANEEVLSALSVMRTENSVFVECDEVLDASNGSIVFFFTVKQSC